MCAKAHHILELWLCAKSDEGNTSSLINISLLYLCCGLSAHSCKILYLQNKYQGFWSHIS